MLILVNLALNSPSSAESVETQPPSSTVAVTGSEHTTKAEVGTTVKPTEKPDEKATQKPTKKPDEKKENSKNSENSSKTESSNNSSLENSYNYYSSSGNSSSGSSSSSKSSSNSSSSNSNSSSNTQKATQKPTTKPEPKPTTKPTQPQDNVYLSYSSITVTKGDVVFLSLINAGNGVSWSVSNSSVLQNYGGGSNQCSFKALKKGSATVTASYNGKNYYCTVSVN
ncbi:MAG: hypothetical protein ACI4GX_03475 [Ruminococcus sp.]